MIERSAGVDENLMPEFAGPVDGIPDIFGNADMRCSQRIVDIEKGCKFIHTLVNFR